MVEVIDLLSSSPPRLPSNPPCNNNRPRLSSPNSVFDFSFGDSDTFDILDLASQQPSKRRKVDVWADIESLQPPPKASKSIFDLSSDLGLGSDPPQTESPKSNDNIVVESRNVDDIVFSFSSSAPESSRRPTTKDRLVFELSSDDDIARGGAIETSSQPQAQTRAVFSKRTTNLLATMGQSNKKLKPGFPKTLGLTKESQTASVNDTKSSRFKKSRRTESNDAIESSQQERSEKRETTQSQTFISGKQSKSSARPAKAVSSADKEAEKERKRLEKEQRQLEKQHAAEIAEVNKVKTNKKTSAPEMIVDMPESLRQVSVGKQVEEFLKELEVQCNYYSDEEQGTSFGKVIKWRRKVTAEYDEDNEIWRPLSQPRISNEQHLIVYCKAEELLTFAATRRSDQVNEVNRTLSEELMKSNLDDLVEKLRQRHLDCRPIFLVEGLTSWVKRSLNAKNRAYTAAVRSQGLDGEGDENNNPSSATTQPANSRRKKKSQQPSDNVDLSSITEEVTENLLLHLQLHHQPLQIQQTTSPATTAAQINTLTQHLSTRPYRLATQQQNLSSASFCMTTGQIKTGIDAKETWIQMLQEINRVTPSMAYGIIGAGYSNPTELVRGFRKEGRLMLEDVKKSTNKDGGWSDRRLGPMVSKRVHKVFMGRDPGARDGIA